MDRSPRPSAVIGSTLARVHRNSVRWLAILAPLTLVYLAGAFYLVRRAFGPSRLLDLARNSAEATLVDLAFVIAPLPAIIALYLFMLKRRAVARRKTFVSNYANNTLVVPQQQRGLIYRLCDRQMQIVWNADGEVHGGKYYARLEDRHLTSFRPERFIATGVP